MNHNALAGRSNPQTPREMIRWLTGFNTSKTATIPPYAIVQFDKPWDASEKAFEGYMQFEKDGGAVWKVCQPTPLGISYSDVALFAVNGGTPIPPQGYGTITQDWPAQVLHNGARDGLPAGMPCGPRSRSFYVWSSGASLFTCLGHDTTVQPTLREKKHHLVWIAPTHRRECVRGNVIATTRVYAPWEVISPTNVVDYTAGMFDVEVEDNGLRVRRDGIYQFGFQANLSAAQNIAAPAYLRLQLYRNTIRTGWLGWRLHNVDRDWFDDPSSPDTPSRGGIYYRGIIYSAEWVAVTGYENLKAGDILRVLNTGDSCLVSEFQFWAMRAGHAEYASGQDPD